MVVFYALCHTVTEARSDSHSIVFVNRSRHWVNNEIKLAFRGAMEINSDKNNEILYVLFSGKHAASD